MTDLRDMGRVIFDGRTYPNSYAEPGHPVRVVLCKVCEDTGYQPTDDDTRGEPCDCRLGDRLMPSPKLCKVVCVTHGRMCADTPDLHSHNAHGQMLHVCSAGRWGGHAFYEVRGTL